MPKRNLTSEQKKADTDLWIIALITFGAFGCFVVWGDSLLAFVKDEASPLFLRLLLNAVVQFGVAGLGISVVCLLRKERFSRFGLVRPKTLLSILGCTVCFLPYICIIFLSGGFKGYQPFQISITEEVLKSGFPVNLIGLIVIAVIWGFFEGFNYTVIYDKLCCRYPQKNKWLDTNALVCAVICLLFHSFGMTAWEIAEGVAVFLAIYGMLLVKRKTNNAWGCVFVFCFIWNAF